MSAPLAAPTKATKANLTCRQSTMGRKPEPAANLRYTLLPSTGGLDESAGYAKPDQLLAKSCTDPSQSETGLAQHDELRNQKLESTPLQRGVCCELSGVPATESGRATAARSPFHSPGSGRPSSSSRGWR